MNIKRIGYRLRMLPPTARYLAVKTRRLAAARPQPLDLPENPDLSWYRTMLIDSVDRFNGGLDGRTGMGAYRDDFNGFFHVALDRRWLPMPLLWSRSTSQSRAIYINAEASRATKDNARFLKAVRQGVDCLLSSFRDTKYGGFYWQVTPNGKIDDETKNGYGNVHPVFALADAYAVTHDPRDLQAALDQLAIIEAHFWDADFPGGVPFSRSRDFSTISGVNNINALLHLFEALLALYDVTTGDQRQHIADLIGQQGNFITQHLCHDQAGYTDRGYIAYYHDAAWQPSQIPYNLQTRWVNAGYSTNGHGIEMAYFLSRAVERGFDPSWLVTADKLIRFCLAYTIDPASGAMIREITDYEGQPLAAHEDVFIGWAQFETARALLHFNVVRGANYSPEFRRVDRFYRQHLLDPVYGGVYEDLKVNPQFTPIHRNKGHVWMVNYHHSMYLAEILRLAAADPQNSLIAR